MDLLGEDTKRTIVLETLGQLCTGSQYEILSGLNTYTKVKFFLEIIGQAFGLPLDDLGVTGKAAEFYISWLTPCNGPSTIPRPEGVAIESQDDFIQTLVKHLSVVFIPKKGPDVKGSTATLFGGKHVDMCKSILKSFTSLSRCPEVMSEASWKVLIKVTLGISDSLLRLPLLPPCYLADELTEDLLATCLEVFLRSKTHSASLWKALKVYYQRWCHRIAAVSQWAAISLALTQRASLHLYGQGTAKVVYMVHGLPVELDLGTEYEVFAWKYHLGKAKNRLCCCVDLYYRIDRAANSVDTQRMHQSSAGNREDATCVLLCRRQGPCWAG